MTPRRLGPAILVALALALPAAAQAQEPAAMSEAERAAFRAEVRAYLMENPEVLMEAIAVLEAREEALRAEADSRMVAAEMAALVEDGHSWAGGNPDGDVTLVEFMDYRCGYCRQAHAEVADLVAGDGEVRLILKEFPILGEESVAASRFAIAVQQVHGPDAYKDAHDALMALEAPITPETLARLAEGLALDPGPILQRMEAPEVTAVIEANTALAQRLAISGTPTFVMGDRMLRGYLPLDRMRALLDEERAG